ncbi:MAG TPA: GPP34 family phosphoprotein [Micromonosporaceae bacterium]
MPNIAHDRNAQPSVRAELFLIAHDDMTGRLLIDKKRLETGLAAAILLELWLFEYIVIGYRYDARNGPWQPEPGRITMLHDTETGDPLIDSAIRLLQSMGAPRIQDFIRAYTEGGGLYERVRGDMTATGLLQVSIKRRFFRGSREVYTSVHSEHRVRARTRVCNLITRPRQVTRYEEPGYRVPALAGLVAALGLTRHFNSFEISPADLRQRLNEFVYALPDAAIREVATAITQRRRVLAAISR